MRLKNPEDRTNYRIGIGAIASALYILLMPLSIGKVAGGASIMRYLAFFVAAVYFLELYTNRDMYKIRKERQSIYSFYILYIIISCVSLLWSVNTRDSLNIFIGLLLTFGIYFFFTLRPYNEREYFLLRMSWVVIAVVIASITIFYGVQSGYQRTTIGFLGGMEDKNQLAGYFILPIIYLIDWMLKRKILIPGCCTLIAYMVYSLLLTGSRGGAMALVVGVVVYFFISSKKSIFNKFVILAAIICIALLLYNIFQPYLPYGVTYRMSITSVIGDGGSDRNIIWSNLIGMSLNDPLRLIFGYGLSGTVPYTIHNYAHNHFLQVLFDGGMIALIFFLGLIGRTLQIALKSRIVEFSALCGMLMLSMTITTYTFYKPYWIILMMAVLTVSKKHSSELISEDKQLNKTVVCKDIAL